MARESKPRDVAIAYVLAFVTSIALWALILSATCPT